MFREFCKRYGYEKTYNGFLEEARIPPTATITKAELLKNLGIESLFKKNKLKGSPLTTTIELLVEYFTAQKQRRITKKQSPEKKEIERIVTQPLPETVKDPKEPVPLFIPKLVAHRDIDSGEKRKSKLFGGAVGERREDGEVGPHLKIKLDKEKPRTAGVGKRTKFKVEGNIIQEPTGTGPGQATTGPETIPATTTTITTTTTTKKIKEERKTSKEELDPLDELDELLGEESKKLHKREGEREEKKGNIFQASSQAYNKFLDSEIKQKRGEEKVENKIENKVENREYLHSYRYSDKIEMKKEYGYKDKVENIVKNRDGIPMSKEWSNKMKNILFGSGSSNLRFTPSWVQGFFFSPYIPYGLFQNDGGPCGVIACVQGHLMKHLLFVTHSLQLSTQLIPNSTSKFNCLFAALADIFITTARGRDRVLILLPQGPHSNTIYPLDPFSCLLYHLPNDWQLLFYFLLAKGEYFTNPKGNGILLFLYSILFNYGLDEITARMDSPDNTLISRHGYCAQELINLMLLGDPVSNVFDGNKTFGETNLYGISEQAEIGFLTLFEAYDQLIVGNSYKSPKLPIWVICSESHYSTAFSGDIDILQGEEPFDLYYYDELAEQENIIRLSVYPGQYKKLSGGTLEPPLELVLRTKWKNSLIDWNGANPIL